MIEETPKVPDYEILRCIGVGGYGKVYLARNSLGGHCAIKLVRHAASSDDKAYERELNGLRLFSDISRLHEGFVDVLHIGRNDPDGYFYYVMELGDPISDSAPLDPNTYAPKTLQSHLERCGTLSPCECVRLGVSLSSALAFLHQRGLVHRDIKPANIIFVQGIARLADPGLVSQIASQMSAVGTLGFMDPSTHGQKLGDIYSLGRVLYVAATGLPANRFPALPTLTAEIRNEFLELNEILLRAGASDPTARYQSAEDLLAHLAVLQAGESIRTVMRLTRWWRGLRRYALWLVLLLLLGVFSAWQVSQSVRQAGELRERRVGSYLAYGTAAVDSQNSLEALPWYAAALELEQDNPERTRNHRLRLGSTLVASPRLIQLWSGVTNPFATRFSPDGRRVLFVDGSGSIVVMDVKTGNSISRCPIKADFSNLIALSPNGNLVFTADETRRGYLWNATNGELLLTLSTDVPSEDLRTAFTPNSEALLIVARTGGTARMVQCASGKILKQYTLPKDGIQDLAWNNTGEFLAVSSRSNGVTVLETQTGRVISCFTNHGSWVYAAAFSPREPILISGGFDHYARLWSLDKGTELFRMPHEGAVGGVTFSPDGGRIATAAFDNLARIFDAGSGSLIGPPLPHESKVVRTTFSAAGNRLLTASLDGSLRVWALDLPKVVWSAPGLTGNLPGDRLVWCEASNIIATQIVGQPVKRFSLPESQIESLLLDAPGHHLLVCSRRAKAIPAANGLLSPANATHTEASLWDFAGQQLGQPFEPSPAFTHRALSSDGFHLAIVDGETLRVWNTQSGESLANVPLQTNCNSLVWHPSLNRIALALGTQAVIYDVALRRMLWPHAVQHSNSMPIVSMSFSPDGKLLATACRNSNVDPGDARLWNAETGDAHGPALRHKDGVRNVAFSPLGRWVATASDDCTAVVRDVADARIVGRALRLPDAVLTLSFASGRSWLATACRNGDVRIWDLETSEPLTPPLHYSVRVVRLRFAENDNALLTETADGRSWLWRFSFDDRPVEQIQRWAHILSAGRSGPPLKNSMPSPAEAFKELNPAPAQSKALPATAVSRDITNP